MPRITGPNIAAHVAAQEEAVLEAARRLVTERGFAAVSLADIAEEVGLRRTSVYRYFPTKGHILLRWFDSEMGPLVESSLEAVAGEGSAYERLDRWLSVQLAFLLDAEHAALMAAGAAEDLPEEVAARIGSRHQDLYSTLAPLLREGGARRAEIPVRAALVAGLLRSAGDLARQGVPRSTVHRELVRASAAVAGL